MSLTNEIYVIGEPNGAGKTTSATSLFPQLLDCQEYINADFIAAALSPFHPESVALQAGRLMLERMHFLAKQQKSFAFETTLSSRGFAHFLANCKKNNYVVRLIFLWLRDPRLAVARVEDRVALGGHHIPRETILRRYKRSVDNFLNIYSELVDNWVLYDNSFREPRLIAKKKTEVLIHDAQAWEKFQESACG